MPLTRIDSAFLDLDAIGGIDFDVNSNVPTLKVDATNHRVGLGHNSPTEKLHVVGKIKIEDDSPSPGLIIRDTATNGDVFISQYNSGDLQIINNATSRSVMFQTHDGTSVEERLRITSDGNVGIGTNNPATKLDVNGSIKSSGYLGPNTAGGSLWLTTGVNTQDPSVALWAKDHVTYPGQTHILGRTSNASNIAGQIRFYTYDGSAWSIRGMWGKNGYFGIRPSNSDPEVPLHIQAGGANDRTAHLTKAADTNFRLTAANGSGTNVDGEETARFGMNYASTNAWGEYIKFVRGTGAANGSMGLYSSNTERVHIKADGNVGISTNNPADKFHVLGSATISTDATTIGNQYSTLTIGERPAADSYASIQFNYDGNSISSKIDGGAGDLSVWANWNSTSGERLKILGTSAAESVILRPGSVDVIKAEHNTSTGASATYFKGTAQFQRTDTANEGGDIRLSRAVDDVSHYSIDVYGNSTTNPRLRIVNVTASREDFHVQHNGNIGIGTNASSEKLVIHNGVVKLQGTSGGADTRVEFNRIGGRNGWIGIPEWDDDALMIYGPGVSSGNFLAAACEGGQWSFSGHNGTSSTEGLRIGQTGNVGIGTNNPTHPLHVEEIAYFRRGIQVTTLASNELQTRSPINSGFYNVNNTTTADGWPFTGWAHLLATTHSNTTNYHSQQFTSSFLNQELYFRNTNSSTTTTSQSWGQVMHTGSTLKPVYAESSGNTDAYSRYWYPGGEYYVSVHNITAPGDMNDMLEQGYYHVANNASNNPTPSYGYLNVNRHAGSQYSLQHFIVSSDTSRQWMRASYPDTGGSNGRSWYQWHSYGALERENQFTNRQNIIGPTSTSTFTGLNAPTSSNRAQLVLHSDYSDLVISSAQTNTNGHGSSLSFAASNPANAADYNKFVICKGNWGTRTEMLTFGYENTEHTNPHTYINSGDNVITLDGQNKRVGIGAKAEGYAPAYPLDVNFDGDSGVRIKCHDNHASLYIDAGSGSASYIRLRRGGAEKFWITSDGNDDLCFRPNGGGTTVKFFNNGNVDFSNNTSVYAKLLVQRNSTTGTPTYTQGQIELRSTNNYTPAIGFHRSGYTASTIYESAAQLYINQNAGSIQTGKIVVSSTTFDQPLYIRYNNPTVYLRDTDHNSAMLHCNSDRFYVLRGADDSTTWAHNSTGRWPLTCDLANSNVTIGGNGYINGTTAITSDERLKTDIQSITGALETVKSLRGVTFYRTDINQDQLKSGLIAQEVEPILPHIVDETVQQDLDTGEAQEETRFKCIAYEELHPYLIEAIKEQQALIEALTARIDALENP